VTTRGPFRAVSLDLWFTALYYPSENEIRWNEDRVRVLGNLLRPRTGGRYDPADIEKAIEAIHSRLNAKGLNTGKVDPQVVVTDCAEFLAAELTLPPDEAGAAYSYAGLAEHPPLVNPELNEVLLALEARGIPIIAITNTARRGESWQAFFRSQGIRQFGHIIASCEVGRPKPDAEMFLEASRRLGLPPADILHVGDRWELDVEGARQAGCGAVLYRGLWQFYPDGMYPETDPVLLDRPDVPTIDRLDELLKRGWIEGRK
jgi:HAD superfamily hydrolase (TIGR01509 family)